VWTLEFQTSHKKWVVAVVAWKEHQFPRRLRSWMVASHTTIFPYSFAFAEGLRPRLGGTSSPEAMSTGLDFHLLEALDGLDAGTSTTCMSTNLSSAGGMSAGCDVDGSAAWDVGGL